MQNVVLFPFADYWSLYLSFIVFVLLMLALNLGVFHREAPAVSFKEGLGWSICWMTLGLVKLVHSNNQRHPDEKGQLISIFHRLNQAHIHTSTTVFTTHVRGNE